MSTVTLDKLGKRYANGVDAVRGLDLDVADGEFLVLVGPSGCGKTTALRMVAGLEDITSGELRIGGKLANALPPKERDIAMVFQHYALYPHLTVRDNMGFALRLRKESKASVKKKVEEAAEILGLTDYLDRKPGHLSGGQRQRVAMGRAIVRDPAVFLMDEPLSNLDAKLRVQMRAEVCKLQRRLGVATLYVTHDQTEAMTMGDRVAVLLGGELQQCAPPQELYNRPDNLFVAAFIGSPSMNVFMGALSGDGTKVSLGSQQLAVPSSVYTERPALRKYLGKKVAVGIRPEDLLVGTQGEATEGRFIGDVELVESLGSELLVYFRVDVEEMSVVLPAVDEPAEEKLELGATGKATGSGTSTGVARVSPSTPVSVGQRIEMSPDVTRVQWFDLATTKAIRGE
ncbi:MAG TPA: sn-glycerol-3-phosphate ABC transporter ATP-binding protein UgpC [Acidimicrobiales bacterium]